MQHGSGSIEGVLVGSTNQAKAGERICVQVSKTSISKSDDDSLQMIERKHAEDAALPIVKQPTKSNVRAASCA